MIAASRPPASLPEFDYSEADGRGMPEPVRLAGVRIDPIDFDTAVAKIVARAANGEGPDYVVTPNAHHVVLHQTDPLLREIYEQAFLVVTDGVPLLWAARLLGLKLQGRVNGTDLFERLCAEAANQGLRVFFLGGRDGAAVRAADLMRNRHPSLEVCGTYCPRFGFERDALEQARIVDSINAARPHILFVGLGAPKQEYWMYANRGRVDVPMLLGIGVSFELVSGIVARAPIWMQRSGLVWFFRLIMEPKRLWRRYLVGNAIFCFLIAGQLLSKFATALP
jgi:N-acetylglucosaminyldiphosphoundecaprenol N-acetyl-beta-D-mannosaminyltransferase